ncbi:sucraseferredoxin-like protein (plasmid) [Ketogulonicigenium robustum]|uniref:Sucraseferredoxin-like protein n=1 Tax=Ketogulonicigenium robustum TaxID=92947 RepID=A0A1W6P3C7_9RHOB|nr:sucrase ferredoxin [Ketogulonicigenium robustum]ARO16008.1 sucraseferredoxin-like protein [Ketogulonicigenium robustum]
MTRTFCRDICCAADEPMAGTGKLAERYLILRWPRAKWRHRRDSADGMTPALSQAIGAATAAGLYVALCDRTGDTDALPDLYDPATGATIHRADQATLAALITNASAGAAIGAPAPHPAHTILVCTDSRRDPCCAKWGYATYRALDAIADPAQTRVLQAAHLGGCKYAASLVLLPTRQRYGRLDAETAPAFLAAITSGQPYLPGFRGDPTRSPPEQVAHLALLQQAAGAPVTLQAAPPLDANATSCTVHGQIGSYPATVHLHRHDFTTPARCAAIGTPPAPSPRWLVHRIDSNAPPTQGTPA